MWYFFIENNKINGCGQCPCITEGILNVETTEEMTRNYIEDNLLYVWDSKNEEIIINPNYETDKQARERERLDSLFMTRSDFFDGMIMAFGLGQIELRAIVENILNQINITDIEIKVALNNFDNALNFYRKHTLFTLLNNVEIPINEEMTLIFTSDIWDKFFETKDYHELQKAIHEVEPEPAEEPTIEPEPTEE